MSAQAVVVPVDDDIKGTKPVAFVIPKAGRKPTEDAIKKFALANAPAYQHPRFVWFVDELPLASTNKVDRAALRKLAQERVAAAVSERDYRVFSPIASTTGFQRAYSSAM